MISQPSVNKDHPCIFIVFGMPRTGTTYLYHALAKHPGIFVPYRKESHYFSVNFVKGQPWFASLYEGMPEGTIGADINPMYYLDLASIDRALAYDPDVKVVLGVREPTDFAISLYGNILAHGFKAPPIEQMVKGFDWPITHHSSVQFSLADGFLERRIGELQARFAGRLMLYDFADFDRSPLATLQAIERFLGLQSYFDDQTHENIRINASGRRNPLLLNSLITNQRILDALYKLLPRALIKRARHAYERLSVRDKGQAANADNDHVTAEERAALDRLFASDRLCYQRLFADQPILLL